MRRVLAILAVLATTGCAVIHRASSNFWELERGPSSQAPDPATTPEAVVQVYAARTVGWRGLFAVHTWIALKPSAAAAYTRYEVIGWGVDRGAPALRVNRMGPDNYWFGAKPERLVDHRGDGVDVMIQKIENAVRAYPYPASYRTWPGPNSSGSSCRRRRSARTFSRAARSPAPPRAARACSSRSSASAGWRSAGKKASSSTCSRSTSASS